MNKKSKVLYVMFAVLAIISASCGLFMKSGGSVHEVQNMYGQTVSLYGDGIYANNSIMKAATTKGTDISVILFSFLLLLCVYFDKKSRKFSILGAGLISSILYATVSLVMGITFNRLFLLYVAQFGLGIYSFIFSLKDVVKVGWFQDKLYEKKLSGTSIFLIFAGCSVLIWLTIVVPAIISGKPFENIEIYTTEPTFAIDLGLIFPTALWISYLLRKKDYRGYALASVFLTLVSCVGLVVILQTVVQLRNDIVLPIGQLIGMAVSFIILGVIAISLNRRLLRWCR